MARVTVEDCIEIVPSRFELVMYASQRARQIGAGAPLLVEKDNDKFPVISLREIAGGKILPDDMREELIKSHRRVVAVEDEEEEVIDLMDGEEEWSSPDKEGDTKIPSLQDIAGANSSDL